MPAASLDTLLTTLEQAKRQFDRRHEERLSALIDNLARRRFPDPRSLIRFHEALLFIRVYPPSRSLARRADEVLGTFAARIEELRTAGADLSAFEEPEVSGIAGAALSACFTYPIAQHLAKRYPEQVSTDWDWEERPDRAGAVLCRVLPLLEDDALVEPNIPFAEWLHNAVPRGRPELNFLLDGLARLEPDYKRQAELYESLRLYLRWELGESPATRTRMRLPARTLFCHRQPLLRRLETPLAEALDSPPLLLEKLPARQGQFILDLARDTSAVRYRELHGFTFGDPARIRRAELGRGVEAYVIGLRPEWRLPLRAYHAAMFFKNGVPIGYFEGLSLFERMEAGFNLYYTFREGETVWLYARALRLMKQVAGVTVFAIDPYQIGFENEEGIQSGAFYFYRRMGFRPVQPEAARLAAAEERKIAADPHYRTPAPVLRRLARGPMIFDPHPSPRNQWDRFEVRRLGFEVQRRMAQRFGGDSLKVRQAMKRTVAAKLEADIETWTKPEQAAFENLALVAGLLESLARWPREERTALAQVIRAKGGPDEGRYLLLMQRHARFRAALLRLGSPTDAAS